MLRALLDLLGKGPLPDLGASSPFPFIVGCDRSGTTLLRAMLASHPQMAIPDETYFIVYLAKRRRKYERASGFAKGRFLYDLAHDPNYRRWTISHDEVVHAFENRPPASYADAIRTVFATYARRYGKERYGDKTPVYVMHMDTLATLLPEAVFIHIVRDGRDVGLSLVERPYELPRDQGEAALFWRDRVCTGRRLGAALGSRYLEVRYEDLLENVEATLGTVCAHAQLPFDEKILCAMVRYHERAETLLQDALAPSEHANVKAAPTAGLRNWRAQMAPSDRVLFEAIAGDALRACGYPAAKTERSSKLRARTVSAKVRWTVRSKLFTGMLLSKVAGQRAVSTAARWRPSPRAHTAQRT